MGEVKKKTGLFVTVLMMVAVLFSNSLSVAAKSTKPSQVKSVTTATVSNTSMKIHWKSVSKADGYEVYRSTAIRSGYKKVKTLTGAKTTSYTDKKLKAKKGYYYKVRAYKMNGKKKVYGSFSAIAQAVINEVDIRNVTLNSNKKVELSWLYASRSVGYRIYRSESKNGTYKLVGKVKGGKTRGFTDKKAVWGKTYYYKLANYRKEAGKTCVGTLSQPVKIEVKAKFTITSTSKPYGNSYVNNADYNSETKQYYLLKSYMDVLEEVGGGTLTLNGGTFQLSKNIYVPSGTTLVLNKNTVIQQTTKAKNQKQGLLILVNRGDMEKGTKYSGYNGVHDVKITGDGTGVINKRGYLCAAILMGHNKNITIENIKFTNMNETSHFIEMDASQNVLIQNCEFSGMGSVKSNSEKEAINLDTPDTLTGGFSGTFSKMDKTPNQNVTIKNCSFKNLPTAIGTHMYSDESTHTTKYMHTNIKILNNTISGCKAYGIRVLNWNGVTISGNTFSGITGRTSSQTQLSESVTIMMQGVYKPLVENNVVKNSDRFMQIKTYKYTDGTVSSKPGLAKYPQLFNKEVVQTNLTRNTLINVGKYDNGNGKKGDINYYNEKTYSQRNSEYWNCQ